MLDDQGERLAKRHDSLSLRTLREQGVTPAEIISKFSHEL
jgi:glutamyl-tRNA synthetase